MSATQFIRYPIETNPTTLAELVYAYIQAFSPQWSPNDGNLDTWIIQAFANIMAENRELATDVPTDIFRWYGASLIGLPPIDAAPSTITSTWTMIDSAGHTIPAGTAVGILDAAGTLWAFETVSDVVVASGSSQTTVGQVTLRSIDNGVGTSNLAGVGVALQLIDVLDFVVSVSAATVSSGGVDAESDQDYLDRLSSHLRLLSTRPILPADFAALAREIPGVYRAVAIDGYDPVTSTSGNARMVAVAGVDINGNPISASIRDIVGAMLEANREINFVVNMMDPTVNQIDVAYTAKVLAGYDPDTVEAAINANLAALLAPGIWGTLPTGSPRDWINQPVLRYSDVAAIISNTEGVDYWSALTIGIHGGGLSAADVNLTGAAPLVTLNTPTGTVT